MIAALAYLPLLAVGVAVLCDVLGRRETRRMRLATCADTGCDACFLALLERGPGCKENA